MSSFAEICTVKTYKRIKTIFGYNFYKINNKFIYITKDNYLNKNIEYRWLADNIAYGNNHKHGQLVIITPLKESKYEFSNIIW